MTNTENKLEESLNKLLKLMETQPKVTTDRWSLYISVAVFIIGLLTNTWVFSSKFTSISNDVSFAKEIITTHLNNKEVHIDREFSDKLNTSYRFVISADNLCTKTEYNELARRLDNLEKK
jgi:hypothetical protein